MIRRVDRYELLEEVGTGGMAVVYRGRDTALDREVAIKLLHPHLAARAEARARFSREARAVARLRHPNIVEIYDYAGEAAVESYLVTEFVRGRTLRAFADEERLAYPELGALLARALADALVHAHAAGVIHRDLKPENVLVLEAGGARAVKLVDFGIARILASDDRMTMTGALVGSPNHMAPEIIEGREADARSDVFSLGTILYWLATGRLPFEAPNPTATLRRVIDADHADPRDIAPRVSDELAAAIQRAMTNDPCRRTPTAAALRDDIDAALAAAGLVDPDAELQAFLADVAGYPATIGPRLVAAAMRQADAGLAAGDTAGGMRRLDRVLAIDPENAAVRERLARIAARARRGRRGRRAAGLAAALGVIAVAGWTGWRLWPRHAVRPEPGQAPLVALPSAPGGAANPSAPRHAPAAPAEVGVPRDRADAEATRAGPDAPTPAPPARVLAVASRAATGKPAQVTVHVRPYAQRVLLDGVEVAKGEQRVSFGLTPGAAHRVQIEHPCCFTFVRDFRPGEVPQPLELKVPLVPRPARLRVEGEGAARVYVDGKLLGTAADSQRAPLQLAIPAGGESPYEAAVELRVERDASAPVLATLRVRAGSDVTFAVPVATAVAPGDAGAELDPGEDAAADPASPVTAGVRDRESTP